MGLQQRDLKTNRNERKAMQKKRGVVAVSVKGYTAISINGLQVPSTYIDIYIDVWSQACQSIHIDVVVTELWGGGPSGCAGGGGGSWG